MNFLTRHRRIAFFIDNLRWLGSTCRRIDVVEANLVQVSFFGISEILYDSYFYFSYLLSWNFFHFKKLPSICLSHSNFGQYLPFLCCPSDRNLNQGRIGVILMPAVKSNCIKICRLLWIPWKCEDTLLRQLLFDNP